MIRGGFAMAQATSHIRSHWQIALRWIFAIALLAVAVAATLFHRHWLPSASQLFSKAIARTTANGRPTASADSHAHAAHDHDHAGHNDANSLELSEQARKNIGLKLDKVRLQPFTKTINIPGMIIERPGRSTLEVTAPMSGLVTRIYSIEGEAVEPGKKLFDLRLTHEDLVQSQTELLKTAEELDVTAREIKRIENLIREQALPGKQLLERQYEQQKQQAALRALRQSLVLHGLAEAQIDAILEQRRLLRDLTVTVPAATEGGGMIRSGDVFQVQKLKVSQGQHVNQGDSLAVLADHADLFIEGKAFERDVTDISRAAERNLPVSAIVETNGSQPELVANLKLLYLATKIDPDARTLDFYVTLPNEKTRDTRLEEHRFVGWRFRPGQRVQLQIPVETLPDRIVLPVDAVALDGAETYVFTPNGDHFDRRSVHVEYRDQQWVVVANDGSLFPGETVAVSAAQQLQLALKNKAGGGIDPHAGHNH
jgi:cobalt-zinc-cadmium efflux system membrane fusion protein